MKDQQLAEIRNKVAELRTLVGGDSKAEAKLMELGYQFVLGQWVSNHKELPHPYDVLDRNQERVAENVINYSDALKVVTKLKEEIALLETQINKPCEPDYVRRNEQLEQQLRTVREDRNRLINFEKLVHEKLDQIGIKIDPGGPGSMIGCRIADRLAIVAQIVRIAVNRVKLVQKEGGIWLIGRGFMINLPEPRGFITKSNVLATVISDTEADKLLGDNT